MKKWTKNLKKSRGNAFAVLYDIFFTETKRKNFSDYTKFLETVREWAGMATYSGMYKPKYNPLTSIKSVINRGRKTNKYIANVIEQNWEQL